MPKWVFFCHACLPRAQDTQWSSVTGLKIILCVLHHFGTRPSHLESQLEARVASKICHVRSIIQLEGHENRFLGSFLRSDVTKNQKPVRWQSGLISFTLQSPLRTKEAADGFGVACICGLWIGCWRWWCYFGPSKAQQPGSKGLQKARCFFWSWMWIDTELLGGNSQQQK